MDNLGPCPLCGCECEQNHRGIECTECSYCLDGMEKQHNRLSAMGELCRTRETDKLLVDELAARLADVVGAIECGDYYNDVLLSQAKTVLEKARKRDET